MAVVPVVIYSLPSMQFFGVPAIMPPPSISSSEKMDWHPQVNLIDNFCLVQVAESVTRFIIAEAAVVSSTEVMSEFPNAKFVTEGTEAVTGSQEEESKTEDDDTDDDQVTVG
jgi:hypothetical protein